MSKAQDMQNESVVALRGWLDFLDEQDSELRSQLERLRRKEKQSPADGEPTGLVSEDELGDADPDKWM